MPCDRTAPSAAVQVLENPDTGASLSIAAEIKERTLSGDGVLFILNSATEASQKLDKGP